MKVLALLPLLPYLTTASAATLLGF